MATKRSPYDFYPTPRATIYSLLDTLKKYNINLGNSILEPCAGDGALIAPLLEYNPQAKIYAYDIDESHSSALQQLKQEKKIEDYCIQDILTLNPQCFDQFLTIITNPPFSNTQKILEHLLNMRENSIFKSVNHVIILQRLGFLGSQKRHDFWNKYPPNAVWAVSKRPSFTGQGTDAHEYGWFIWGDINGAPPILAI